MGGKGNVEFPDPWDFDFHVDPVELDTDVTMNTTLNSNSTLALSLNPTDEGHDAIGLAISVPGGVTTDSTFTMRTPDQLRMRNEVAITEPIEMNANVSADLSLDVKPVVLDLCLTLGLKELPRVCISRPYDRKVAFTLFGVEVFGFERRGERRIIVDDLPKKPFVAVGGEHHRPQQTRGHEVVDVAGSPGLRISVG